MEDKLYYENDFTIGNGECEPNTLTIEGVEHIYLTQKGIDIKVNIHINDFDKIKAEALKQFAERLKEQIDETLKELQGND